MGKMGLPLACVFADADFDVIGIDVDEKRVAAINAGENPIPEETGLDLLLQSAIKKGFSTTTQKVEADIHIILIPILLVNGRPDFSILTDVCKKIASVLKKDNIVVLESTAPPGTCETVLIPLLEEQGFESGKDFGVAHCPERTMTGTALEDITKKYPKIVGASDCETGKILRDVYSRINEKGVILLKDIKTAEAVKVFEGIYRDVNIALVNELALYCEEHSLDITEVIKAANTQPYCHLHEPGAGVGGHCIPVYPYFVMSEKTDLIRTARKINESMPYHVVDLTEELLRKSGLSLRGARILLLGITFRRGVKEERFSPFFPVRDELHKRGAFVYGRDPLYTKEETERYVTYCADFNNIDCIVILTDHTEFVSMDWKYIRQAGVRAVIDGRNILNREKMESLDFIYTGIGR
ncbi:MAG: nucleotide sugar dehydrogenase [Theionarchaea archaeon]|nr:nucleotide sugar dehydrogenase [Theionarchaea archaeon]